MEDGTPHSASMGDRAAVVTRERVTLSPRGCGATMGHARPESTCNTILHDPGAPAPRLHIGTQLRCCDPRGAMPSRLANASRGANRETGWVGRPTWPVFGFVPSGGSAAGVGPPCPTHQVRPFEESCVTPF